MIDDMAVYIANLGKYNEGYLVGACFATTYPHRIMIRPHGAVLPTRMGIVEILMELSKAVCLLVKNDTQ